MADEQMQREFLEQPDKRDRKQEALTRKWNQGRTRLNKETPEHKEKNERWKLYKAIALDTQKKTQGFFSCCECGSVQERSQLQFHHITRRGQGGDYHFSNGLLVGSGPTSCGCHERLDGNDLRWSSRD